MAVAMRTMTPTYEKYRDPEATSDTRTYSMFMHIESALILVDPTVVLHFVATLVMWLSRGKDSPFIDDHGREAVNFQISCFILTVGGTVALVVLAIVSLCVLATVAALLTPLGLDAPFWTAMGWGTAALLAIAETAASWPHAQARVDAFGPGALAAMALGGLIVAVQRGIGRLVGAPVFAFGLSLAIAAPAASNVSPTGSGTAFTPVPQPTSSALSSSLFTDGPV